MLSPPDRLISKVPTRPHEYIDPSITAYGSAQAATEIPHPQEVCPRIPSPDRPNRCTVWYGTNRAPLGYADSHQGYSADRSRETSYGICKVMVPRSHKFGSLGSPLWARVLHWEDDRVALEMAEETPAGVFWNSIRQVLEGLAPTERQAMVYLHGYNTTFQEAAVRAAQIGFDLKIPGVMAFFSWPSKGGLTDYPADEAAIEASEAAITAFLIRFATVVRADRVHVIAHSMGNRGLLRAMQRIQADAMSRTSVKFGQIFLAAPDIDVDVFRDLAKVYPSLSDRTTLYVSPSDRAVQLSGLIHEYDRVGHTPPVTVVSGIDTIDIPQFNLLDLGHGYYAEAAPVLHDMFDLLRRNAPPNDRQRLHQELNEENAIYWQLA